jgi:DNA-binding Lrp family transcriptional regulator
MPSGDRSGHLSIVPEVAIDDIRMGHAALRMLVALGTYADQQGWCYPKQKTLSDRLGISRQSVSAALRELAEMGYIEIHAQYSQATGSRIESRYRIVMNVRVEPEFLRSATPDIAPHVKPELTTHVKPTFTYPPENFTGDVKPRLTPPVKATFTSIEERPKGTTQGNDPIDSPAVSDERVVFDYYRERVQPSARLCPTDKIRTRLKTFTVDELKRGIDHFADDAWWMENNGTRGAAWFFHSDARSEQFLNLKPRTALPSKPARGGSDPPRRKISEAARRAAAEWESL